MTALGDRLERAADRIADLRVTCLPDLFIDHVLPVRDAAAFHDDLQRVRRRGGGNLMVAGQSLRLGGNAANTAHALGRLGVPVSLIARTDPVGRALLEATVAGLPVDTEGVHADADAATTLALEYAGADDGDGANVMVSDPGPLPGLGPDVLDDADRHRIATSDLVLVTNWSMCTEHGTQLAADVLRSARRAGVRTMMDTADPTHRGAGARDLLDAPDVLANLDVWSVNAVEAAHFAGLDSGNAPADPVAAARVLAGLFDGRVDLHTDRLAASTTGDDATIVGTFDVRPERLTGAGDAWNAGNILGDLLELEPRDRLTLANAVAAATITSVDGRPPGLDAVIELMETVEPRPAPADRSTGDL